MMSTTFLHFRRKHSNKCINFNHLCSSKYKSTIRKWKAANVERSSIQMTAIEIKLKNCIIFSKA